MRNLVFRCVPVSMALAYVAVQVHNPLVVPRTQVPKGKKPLPMPWSGGGRQSNADSLLAPSPSRWPSARCTAKCWCTTAGAAPRARWASPSTRAVATIRSWTRWTMTSRRCVLPAVLMQCWCCVAVAVLLLWYCYCAVLLLLYYWCIAVALLLPCCCCVIAVLLLSYCRSIAVVLESERSIGVMPVSDINTIACVPCEDVIRQATSPLRAWLLLRWSVPWCMQRV